MEPFLIQSHSNPSRKVLYKVKKTHRQHQIPTKWKTLNSKPLNEIKLCVHPLINTQTVIYMNSFTKIWWSYSKENLHIAKSDISRNK